MRQSRTALAFQTSGPGLTDLTRDIADWVHNQKVSEGLLTVFIRHTSASLVIQENADPDVLTDLQNFFSQVAPHTGTYRHSTEGPDDMPAHIKSALTQTSLSLPVTNGHMALGTWQGIYLFEHRDHPHRREVLLHLMGE